VASNTVSDNTILNASVGLALESGDTATANKFNFVATAMQPCY
jgi:hypothetical protein